jgi:hypothetical protein
VRKDGRAARRAVAESESDAESARKVSVGRLEEGRPLSDQVRTGQRTEILNTSDAPLSSIKGSRLPLDSTAGGSTGRKTGRRGRARERCRPRVVIVRGCVVLAGGASL